MPEKKISIRDLSMVYGHAPHIALNMLKSGKNRSEILQSTGMTVGVYSANLDVYEHELLVVMGLSGSGKSTLLKCLNLLNRPSAGEIFVDGEDILKYTPKTLRHYRLTKVSMVFQEFGLLPHRTTLENIGFGLEVGGMSKKHRQDIAGKMAETVGLGGYEHHYPRQLSGGMQQRVGLARALVHEPDILLMDEPFSALDPLIRRQMQTELLALQKKFNKTIVFITHDINEAFTLGNRIAIMKEGVIEQIGTPVSIMQNPATDYVAAFIEGINKLGISRCRDIMNPCTVKNADISAVISLRGDQDVGSALAALRDTDENAQILDNENNIIGVINQKDIINFLVKGL